MQSFDVYALTGSGTNLEPAGEGYMGILNDVTGAPNITGQALIAASQRWQADPDERTGPLRRLHDATQHAPAARPRPHAYERNLRECARSPMRAIRCSRRSSSSHGGGRVPDPAPATTRSGQTGPWCLQNGPPITSFDVYAEVSNPLTTASFTSPNIAQSATYRCPISVNAPTATCTVIAPAPAAAAAAAGAAARHRHDDNRVGGAADHLERDHGDHYDHDDLAHDIGERSRLRRLGRRAVRGGSSQTGAFRPAPPASP